MRVYAYGALAPTQNADVVAEQIRLAHRYRNELVAIRRAEAAVTDAIWAPYRERRRVAIEAAGGVAQAVPKSVLSAEDAATVEFARETANAYGRAARAASGVYWGTYLCVEDAVQRAIRSDGQPQFHRWDGSGTVAVEVIRGMSIADLEAGNDTRVRLGPPRSLRPGGNQRIRDLWLRVGSDGRAPVWAVFPVVYHRHLPAGARIKWVRVVGRRVATKTRWIAQFVLDGAVGSPLPVPVGGTVAIDVGWRRMGYGTRVATWVDDAGRSDDLVVPTRLTDRWTKVHDLRSIRGQHFNAATAALISALDGIAGFPDWLAAARQHMASWHSQARLAALAIRWRTARFAGDAGAFEAVEAWRKKDKHLYEWERHQEANILAARLDLYRCFAARVARYKKIVVEHLDLRDFAELPPPAKVKGDLREDPRTAAARGRRFQAALSELFRCIADAAARSGSEFVEVPAPMTTQTCYECGQEERFDAAATVDHVCQHCRVTWDKDRNAAKNLLRAAKLGKVAGGRSRAQSPAAPGESAADKRRAKGLATRRAKRSRMDTEDAGLTTE